jgi:nucleotide-binding universal stress UspA family protein
MFGNAIVGVKEIEASRDAIRLARVLTSADGDLTLPHVRVVASRPAPDSGAAGSAAKRRYAIERLAALRDESQLDAEVAHAEARDVRQGLHDLARARDADLLVIGASRADEIYRDLVGDEARELLNDPPCAVAVAPAGYCAHRAPLTTIGVAYDRAADSDHALAVARALAADAHARLSAFHAVTGLHLRDPGRSRRAPTMRRPSRVSGSSGWAASRPTRSTATRSMNSAAMEPQWTCWCSARTDTVRSGAWSNAGRHRDWPTNQFAHCSWCPGTPALLSGWDDIHIRLDNLIRNDVG